MEGKKLNDRRGGEKLNTVSGINNSDINPTLGLWIYLLMRQCNLKENLELSGTIKVPSHMAT